jgi:hypothetical protein
VDELSRLPPLLYLDMWSLLNVLCDGHRTHAYGKAGATCHDDLSNKINR